MQVLSQDRQLLNFLRLKSFAHREFDVASSSAKPEQCMLGEELCGGHRFNGLLKGSIFAPHNEMHIRNRAEMIEGGPGENRRRLTTAL